MTKVKSVDSLKDTNNQNRFLKKQKNLNTFITMKVIEVLI